MNVGDWVHTPHNMNKITGFVINVRQEQVEIFVTIPKNYGTLVVELSKIIPGDDCIWLDDIPTLIDLSLKIKDHDWFDKWMYELSLWKKVEDVF